MGCDFSLHKHYLFCVSNTGVVIYCALPAMFIHQYVMAAIMKIPIKNFMIGMSLFFSVQTTDDEKKTAGVHL